MQKVLGVVLNAGRMVIYCVGHSADHLVKLALNCIGNDRVHCRWRAVGVENAVQVCTVGFCRSGCTHVHGTQRVPVFFYVWRRRQNYVDDGRKHVGANGAMRSRDQDFVVSRHFYTNLDFVTSDPWARTRSGEHVAKIFLKKIVLARIPIATWKGRRTSNQSPYFKVSMCSIGAYHGVKINERVSGGGTPGIKSHPAVWCHNGVIPVRLGVNHSVSSEPNHVFGYAWSANHLNPPAVAENPIGANDRCTKVALCVT